jgi:adenylate cyclase
MKDIKWNRSFLIITLTVFFLSMLLFFTPLNSKFFDLFLRVLPSLTENEKVYVLTLDDDSINYAGGFPFRREVMGDVVVLLKEFGVNTIAFDLSYLDETAQRLDPVAASDLSGRRMDSILFRLNDIASQVIDRIGSGTTQRDKELYKQELNNFYMDIRAELDEAVFYLTKDVDEYFAKSLAFADNAWLTLTMIAPEAVLSEGAVVGNTESDQYLSWYIAPKNVIDRGDHKTREMAGVMPALHKLLTRSKGAGFVNAVPDSDGLRRRVNLLTKYNGDYYGQLTLMAIQEMLGWSSIEVTDKVITLKLENGKDLRIPRTQDGSLLLKWPKKNFYDYKYMSLIELIQYTMIEPYLSDNIGLMHDSGFFYCWEEGMTPWDYFSASTDIKNNAFANNSSADDQWLTMRQKFFETCGAFLNGKYEGIILSDVSGDSETENFVRELFDVCRDQYSRLAEIRKNAEVLRGSFSVIGSDATSMTDNGLITFQEFYPNVGTYAVAANMLLSGEFLDDAPWFVSAIIALLYSLVIGFLISRFDTYKSIITGVSGLVLLTGAFLAFFSITKTYIGFAAPLFATLGTFVGIMISKFLTTSREKAFIHSAFSRYLAPDVINEIINDPDKLNLGGEKREMTAIFTDIRSFSTISEQLDPTQLVKLLNRYLTAMSNIIMENKGTIDKYEGDAIIAFFGAPLFHADHPALACRSALAMKTAEAELNKVIAEEKASPIPLFTRIGINTGDMVVGNMGAENKMDYTIMGNAVNLAARLEGVNKQYCTGGILISEYTKDRIGDEFLIRPLDRVRVVGIHTPVRLYELLAQKEKVTESELKAVDVWEKAIALYEQKSFKDALSIFNSLIENDPNDRVADLYAGRCKTYIENTPPPEWDAINNLMEK